MKNVERELHGLKVSRLLTLFAVYKGGIKCDPLPLEIPHGICQLCCQLGGGHHLGMKYFYSILLPSGPFLGIQFPGVFRLSVWKLNTGLPFIQLVICLLIFNKCYFY